MEPPRPDQYAFRAFVAAVTAALELAPVPVIGPVPLGVVVVHRIGVPM